MNRFNIAFIAYSTTGIGIYQTFFGKSELYGLLILMVGLIGVLYDVFYKKLNQNNFIPLNKRK
jgi:hypothetical protein